MSSYYETIEFTARLGEQQLRVMSKQGIAAWDRASPASDLLAGAVAVNPASRVLVLGCGHGALGAALALRNRTSRVELMDASWIAIEMARRTIKASGATNARVLDAIDIPTDEPFDVAALEVPSDRRLARRWLAQAHAALAPSGELYLAGPNDHGIRSAIADAEALFGAAAVLGYKSGNRVGRAAKLPNAPAPPAWASEPGVAPGTWHEFGAEVGGQVLRLRSLPGVFAYDRVDDGTRLLLAALDIPAGGRVLDLGCGCGIVGMGAALRGAAHVDMVDSNLLAVAAARENIRRAGVEGAHAFASDGVPLDAAGRYDLVATNPPFHVGKQVDNAVARAFIAGARRALRPGGSFFLVANRFLSYTKLLRESFDDVACVAETRSFRVWKMV
jgi:16S rRNA (guanine1207-N2)-methyltransferase